jgi:hypothetical protein
VKFRPG